MSMVNGDRTGEDGSSLVRYADCVIETGVSIAGDYVGG